MNKDANPPQPPPPPHLAGALLHPQAVQEWVKVSTGLDTHSVEKLSLEKKCPCELSLVNFGFSHCDKYTNLQSIKYLSNFLRHFC